MKRDPWSPEAESAGALRAQVAVHGYAHHALRVERTVGWILWTALVAVLLLNSV